MLTYKRMIITLITGIMMLGEITFSTGHPIRKAMVINSINTKNHDSEYGTATDSSSSTAEPTNTPTPIPEPTATPIIVTDPTDSPDQVEEEYDPDKPNPLTESTDPELLKLIESYYSAAVNADFTAINDIVTNPKYINTKLITRKSQIIKEYSNIKCYTKKGYGDITYVVYCTSDMFIPTLSTPIASLESFYITYRDGKPYIFSGFLDEKTQTILNDLDTSEDVITLNNTIIKSVVESRKKDPLVDGFIQKLIDAVGENDQLDTEESSSGQTSN